jgi:serine/threonine-protein kinase
MTHEPGSAPAEGDDPLLGVLLAGRYRLLEKIGEGAMGAVYRGAHETLRKPVAVKLLGRAARADREMVTRFEREAVAAANLKHPAIAEATDSGQMPDGTLFMVMEYVQGRSLRAILKQDGKLPPARALHLLRQMGSAVAFAHGLDVVHRDLKPENVVVFDRGEERDLIKIIDFGIARMRSSFGGGPSGLTQIGSVVGTAEYMAPEQAMGQAVDARADQYAMGVIAFELLTGRPPYVAEDVASLVYMHVGAPIPRVTERAPELPAAVDDAVAKMMGKLPDERFASLSEAIAALAGALDGSAPAPAAAPLATPTALPRAAPFTGVVQAYTASGTIISPPRPGAPPAAMPIAAPIAGPIAASAPPSPAPPKHRELVIILVSVAISVIGLVVIVAIFLTRWGSSAADAASSTGDPSADAPPTLNPTSREPSRMRPKGKGHGKGKHGDD